MKKYLLSKLLPVRMDSTHIVTVDGRAVELGTCGNHFRDDSHRDLVSVVWWQWRGRCFRQRKICVCIDG